MSRGFFVTGTDTNVGKTLIAGALLHGFAASGLRAVGMKPVAAGCEPGVDGLRCEDVEFLRAAGNVSAPPGLVCPYAFEPAVAPHVAAAQAGVEIDLSRILAAFGQLSRDADVAVVEGVGGFRVPLNTSQDTADLARLLGLPVVLVVGMRLGCLNHALLTAQAIEAAGLPLAGWVANRIDPEMTAFEETLAALERRLGAPLLGVVPYLKKIDLRHVQGCIILPSLR